MASPAALNALLDKASDWDKDERYMATNDLITELQRDVTLDAAMERRICAAVLRQLDDKSTDVQSIAVKCLGVLLKKVREAQVGEISDKLCSLILDGTDELRDVYSIGLKTLLRDVPRASGEAVAGRLAARLVGGVKDDEKAVARVEALENLTDLLKRFGASVQKDHGAVLDAALQRLDDDKNVVRKRAAHCLAALALTCSEPHLEKLVITLLRRVDAAGKDASKARTPVAAIGTVARSVGQRLGTHLDRLVPALVAPLGSSDDAESNDPERNELRETCLHGLEELVIRCSAEAAPHVDALLETALAFAAFDPNYSYDEDEDMEEAEEEDDEEYDDDYGDEDDDDDTSWKVRRAAVRVCGAVAQTRTDQSLITTLAPALVKRFKEREENVRVDVIDTLTALVKASKGSESLRALAPAACKACKKPISLKIGDGQKTKSACFNLLRELCACAPPDALLGDDVKLIADAAGKGLQEKSQALRLEGAKLLRSALARKDAGASSIVKEALPHTISAVGAEWYKLIEEGLRLCVAVADLVRPLSTDMTDDDGLHVATQLLEAARPRLVTGAVDLEIRERAIECVGEVTARFADVMDAALLEGVISDLNEQLEKEATRCAALRALTLIASSPRASPVASLVLVKGGLGMLASFLEHHARPLRQATLEALGALLRTVPLKTKLKAGDVSVTLVNASALAKDADLHLAHLATKAIAAGIDRCPLDKKAKAACEANVLPAAFTLAASPLLQGAPLDGLADVFEAVATKGGGGALGFDALLDALPAAAQHAAAEDPVRGSRQARQNVAVVMARLCACADAATLKKAVATLVGQVTAADDGARLLAVCALGELGRRVDVSKQKPSPIEALTAALGGGEANEADEGRTVAAAALGSCVAGAPHELSGLLDDLDAEPCPREYLLLIALREVVAHAPKEHTEGVALRIVQRLLRAVTASSQETVADSASECAGALAAIAPKAVAQHFLDPLLQASETKHRASAATCARSATSAKHATDTSVEEALVERLEPLLKLLDDDDLDCKKQALGLVHAAAHNRLSLLAKHAAFVEARLATLAALKIEHVVDLGPFKHKVDDGLPLRKAALAALATLVDRAAITNVPGCVDVVAGALADKNADVQAQAHQLLVKLCALDAPAVLAKADAICAPLDKSIHKKIKEGTAKDDRAWGLVRSALRAALAVKELPGGCPGADALLEKARGKEKLAAELTALAK